MNVSNKNDVIIGTKLGEYSSIRENRNIVGETCQTTIPNEIKDEMFRMKLHMLGIKVIKHDDTHVHIETPLNWKHLVIDGSVTHEDTQVTEVCRDNQMIIDDRGRARIAINTFHGKSIFLTRFNYGVNLVTKSDFTMEKYDALKILKMTIYFTDSYHRFENTEIEVQLSDINLGVTFTSEGAANFPNINHEMNKIAEKMLDESFPNWRDPFAYWE
jgi:hypothetical protein